MSIRKRGNSYQVDVKVRGRRTRRDVGTKSEARELEGRLREELKAIPARGLEEALVQYLKGEALTLRDQKGIRNNSRAIRPFIAGKTLDQAPDAATEMKEAWLASGLLPATINRRLALLRRLCNLSFEWGWTEKAIGKRIKLLPGERERHIYLTKDEVEALAALMPRSGDLVRFSAYTGLRLGEVMQLDAKNVAKGAVVLYDTKNGQPRTVPVPKRINHLLKRIPWPVTNEVRRDEWTAARAALDLKHVHWHDLRHTYASWLAERGASDRELGSLLGHRSAQMVKRYAHLRQAHLAKRVDSL